MRYSPLDQLHRNLGAKMVPFGGWEMPLAYSDGTIAEHDACRTGAVVFDVSHLGTLRMEGPDAHRVLQYAFTNDIDRIGVGRAQYTHLLDPATASVIDDIIVWWLSAEVFDVVPNASNTAAVMDVLDSLLSDTGTDIRDTTDERALLAVAGPHARQILSPIAPDAADVGRFRVKPFSFLGADCWVAGTGYTGEDGVECAVPLVVAEQFFTALCEAGVKPAGLGARDTLRLEAGFPLHGHELGDGITTLEADLGWVVGWDKGDFIGREALASQKAAGVKRIVRGLSTQGRRPPRDGQTVLFDGVPIGYITSGNFSPTLGHGIAMALIDPSIETGSRLEIDVRGKMIPAEVVPMPFVKAGSS